MLTALPTASIIRAALWGFGQLFPFSEFFDNPGKSLIQSAKYLLSWFRIGRYQCPPRKELQDTRFATSPTRHRIAGCERSVRAVRFPETQVSIVSIALRDQLIHNILVWRAVQRESLTRQGSKAGKIRVRTGRESDRLRWEPEEGPEGDCEAELGKRLHECMEIRSTEIHSRSYKHISLSVKSLQTYCIIYKTCALWATCSTWVTYCMCNGNVLYMWVLLYRSIYNHLLRHSHHDGITIISVSLAYDL